MSLLVFSDVVVGPSPDQNTSSLGVIGTYYAGGVSTEMLSEHSPSTANRDGVKSTY